MRDERALATAARDEVVEQMKARSKHEEKLRTFIASVVEKRPDLSEERVKAAIVSLLNYGVLELRPDGNLRYVGPQPPG